MKSTRKRASVFVAIFALLALLAPLGAAQALEQVAGHDGWSRTGSFPAASSERGKVPDLGTNVHRVQGINGWCAKDEDDGPRSTHGPGFVYSSVRTISSGQQYRPNPDTHRNPVGDPADAAWIASTHQNAFAYLMNTHGASAAARDNAHEAQAVHYALLSLTYSGPSISGHFSQHLAAASVKNRAKVLVDEAWANRGPYKAPITISFDEGDERGFIENVGLKSAAGNWMPGYSYTVKLSGPALFDNGTDTYTGTTVARGAAMGVNSTGVGPVSASIVINGVPNTSFVVLEDETAQDMWSHVRPMTVTGKTEVRVDPTFLPHAVTKATERAKVGESIVDEITMSAGKGSWKTDGDGKPVAVKAKASVYGPFEAKPVQQAAVPADAPLAGVVEVVFDGPQTKTTPGVKVAKPGYYTWVVSVAKSEQSEATQKVLSGDYVSPFGEAVETTTVVNRDKPKVTTKAVPSVKVGEDFTDTAIVTDADGYFKHNTHADHYVGFELFGPSDKPVCEKPVFTSAWVKVDKAGDYTSQATKVSEPGDYHWVETLVEVPKGEKPGPGAKVVHKGECGAKDETTHVTERDKPIVVTKAVPKVTVGEEFGDTAIITDEDDAIGQPGWRWELTFAAYGPYKQAHEVSDQIPEGEKPFFVSKPVTVTGAGEYASDMTKVETVGQVYWVETLVRIPVDADGKDAGPAQVMHRGKWALPEETTTVTARDDDGAAAAQDLATTGLDAPWTLIAIGGTAILAGAGFLVAGKRRRA